MIREGAGLLTEEVGVHAGATMCERFPAEAAAEHHQVAALQHQVLTIADFARLFGCVGKF
jgi:hypothetical protein